MRQFPRSARGVAEQWTISPGDKLLMALSVETSPQGWRGSGVWRRILNACQRHSCGARGPRLGMAPPGSAPWGCRNKAAQWAAQTTDALPPDLEARSSSSWCQTGKILMRTLFLAVHLYVLFSEDVHGETEESLFLLLKGTDSITRPLPLWSHLNLITSLRPHHCIPSK